MAGAKAHWNGKHVMWSVRSRISYRSCWDIKGKDLGQPVWALLGGKVRDRVRVYTHIGAGKVKIKRHSRDIASYSESTSELREQGYTAVKTGPVPYTHYDFDMREVKHT